MAEAGNISPFAIAAADLIARGFHVVPIAPKGKDMTGKSPGERRGSRWVGIPEWERFRDKFPTAIELEVWSDWAEAGIGVVLGSAVGEHQVIAIDIDVEDPDELRELQSAAPYSPMAKRGRKGVTLFYRGDRSLRTKQYKRGVHPNQRMLCEILTGNATRQTVVPPSVHPDTGHAYVWVNGASAVRAVDLPILAGDDILKLEEALMNVGWDPAAATERRPVAPGALLGGPFADINAEALARLDDWVTDLDLYDLTRARAGYAAVATWRGSTTGRPLTERKRNLSIQPSGIKDFGTNQGYSAIDLVMAAKSTTFDNAFAWLDRQLHGELPAAIVVAKGNHLESPAAIEELPEKSVRGNQPAAAFGSFPPDLCYPKGLVGTIAKWIVDTARRPQPALALSAAVTIVGTAMGRQYAGPTASGTHFYALGLAPTGGGKDHPLQQAKRIMASSGMAGHLGPGQFISMTSIINVLERMPLSLCVIDEFASFLSRINDRRSGGFEKAVGGVMRTAWSSSFAPMPTPEWAQKRSSLIQAPALSLLGSATPEEFFASLTGMDAANGVLNRFLIFPGKRVKAVKPLLAADDVPAGISEGLRTIMSAQGALHMASLNASDTDPAKHLLKCGWADEDAETAYADYATEIDEKSEDDSAYAAFHVRAAEYAVRLAHVHAVGRKGGPITIDIDDMIWGIGVARACFGYTHSAGSDYIADTDAQARAQEIVRAIRDKGGAATHRDIMRALDHKYGARDVKDALQALMDSGRVEAEEQPNSRGRPTVWYRLGD